MRRYSGSHLFAPFDFLRGRAALSRAFADKKEPTKVGTLNAAELGYYPL